MLCFTDTNTLRQKLAVDHVSLLSSTFGHYEPGGSRCDKLQHRLCWQDYTEARYSPAIFQKTQCIKHIQRCTASKSQNSIVLGCNQLGLMSNTKPRGPEKTASRKQRRWSSVGRVKSEEKHTIPGPKGRGIHRCSATTALKSLEPTPACTRRSLGRAFTSCGGSERSNSFCYSVLHYYKSYWIWALGKSIKYLQGGT